MTARVWRSTWDVGDTGFLDPGDSFTAVSPCANALSYRLMISPFSVHMLCVHK